MKKLFFLTAALCMLWTSCSSDQPFLDPTGGGIPEAKVPVTINVASDNEFSQLKSVSPDDAGVKSLLYLVYDEASGDYIKYKLIKENLGTIKDTLSQGSYRIAILGMPSVIPDSWFEHGFDFENFPGGNVNFGSSSFMTQGDGHKEHFYKDFTLNVSGTTVPQSVALERITTKLEIVPTDVALAPADLESITFYLQGLENQVYTFSDKSCSNYVRAWSSIPPPYPGYPKYIYYSTRVTKEQLMKVNADNPITILLLPVSSPATGINGGTIPLVAMFMSKNTVYKDRVLKTTYTLESNKILRLTGKLFDDESSSEVSIDDEWDADVVEDNFD